jgi:hypothetical protein
VGGVEGEAGGGREGGGCKGTGGVRAQGCRRWNEGACKGSVWVASGAPVVDLDVTPARLLRLGLLRQQAERVEEVERHRVRDAIGLLERRVVAGLAWSGVGVRVGVRVGAGAGVGAEAVMGWG